MTSRAKYASEGVVIRRPIARPTQAIDPQTTYLCYPHVSADEDDTEWQNEDDAETLAVFQELALRYAMEQTHSAVRTVLLRANKKCYHDVHTYLQRHMHRVTLERARSPAVPRVVALPTLMKFPAVAIVSGSDATFSDVWMTPLCQVIHRSFPVILVIREGVLENVRRMVEWILERLDDYAGMKKREEGWLGEQISAWYAFVEQRKTGQRPVVASTSTTQQPRRLRARTRSTRVSLDQLGDQDDSDDDYIFYDGGESTSESDGNDDENHMSRKKNSKKRKRRGKAGAKRRMKYGDLLLDSLLQKLWEKLKIIQRASDLTLTWTATLREVIQEDLRQQLEKHKGNMEKSIQCYREVIDWIKSRILAYRQLRRLPISIRASTAEFTLAALAYRILTDFLSFVNLIAPQPSTETELVIRLKREIQTQIDRLEDANHLHQFDVPQYEQVAEQLDPYLLICIEHLDLFNVQILRDFVDLWSHYADCHAEHDHSTRVGFILGVTTTTSQTLRQLGLSIMRRMDIQFFSLEDSKTRSDDILEVLFVQNHFPLCLSGDALRLLDDRHLTSQSLTAFTQVLEFYALSHFQESPWSFLSRFAFDVHRHKMLFNDLPRTSPLRRWVNRRNFRGRSLHELLSYFSDDCVTSLLSKFGPPKPSEDRFDPLNRELLRFADRRANWTVGWKCFRLACAWFKLDDKGEGFVECLAMALDGRAAELKKVEWCTTMIKGERIQKLLEMVKDWSVAAMACHHVKLKQEIQELVHLATHVANTFTDPETIRMWPLLREEIADFFHERIVGLMDLDKVKPGTGRAIVAEWANATKYPSITRTHVTLNLHEDAMDSLSQLDDEIYHHSTVVGDVGLAFMHYREHATLQLSVADWFKVFVEAVKEETEGPINDTELNARFARAIATLRLWGYIKGPDGVRGSGRRIQDARVDKRIFM